MADPRAEQLAAVWRLLRRLGVPVSDLDDAAQQVLLVVTERRADILPDKERAFVFGTALRVARTMLREPRLRTVELHDDVALADDVAPIEELLDRHTARRILDQLLEQMSFDYRAVFVLFEIEELSLSEIAQALDIPRGTAASRLRRARVQFEGLLTRVRARLKRGAVP
jgi:RNA polymerase sigma-70 factor (ECF subfamily)